VLFVSYAPQASTPAEVQSLGGASTQRAGALAVHAGVAAIAGTIAGDAQWPGLPAVTAAGAQDLACCTLWGTVTSVRRDDSRDRCAARG
jgi:hypothetical protein